MGISYDGSGYGSGSIGGLWNGLPIHYYFILKRYEYNGEVFNEALKVEFNFSNFNSSNIYKKIEVKYEIGHEPNKDYEFTDGVVGVLECDVGYGN